MLLRYENEKEARQRQLEERRANRQKEEKERMRQFLARQVQEKKARETDDKDNIAQQAQMWNLDKENYDQEEKRLRERINKINHDNASYLKQQMADKNKKNSKMNRAEYAMNKPLLREANDKFKENSQYNPSNNDHSEQQEQI